MENEDPKGNGPDGTGGQGRAKGSPDLKAENARLNEELKAANDRLKASEEKNAELQEQLDSLNADLAKALTEDDVKAAVKEAVDKAESAHTEAQAAWDATRKRLSVENALIQAGCTDTVGCIAHLDLDRIEVAPDGHISGLDVKALTAEHPHLFAIGTNLGTVASAATPGGAAKKITREEIMAEKDALKRRALIAEHIDLFD